MTIDAIAEKGLNLYESGDYEAALEIFNNVVDAESRNPLAYDARGTIYTALNEYENALSDYSRAIELSPSFAQAYYNRGRLYGLLERYDEALSDLEQSIELAPGDFGYRASGNIGLIYHRQGEYEKALEAFEASMSYDNEKADVFYLRGETHTALEDYETAIVDYEDAIQRFSGYDIAYQSLGYAYYKVAKYEEASQALDQALKISPDSPIPHLYLALVHLATGDVESASTEIARAASSFSTLSEEEQELVYDRVVTELKALARENPDKAGEVKSMIETMPEPQ